MRWSSVVGSRAQGPCESVCEGVTRVGCLQEASGKLRPERREVRKGRRKGSPQVLGSRRRVAVSECPSVQFPVNRRGLGECWGLHPARPPRLLTARRRDCPFTPIPIPPRRGGRQGSWEAGGLSLQLGSGGPGKGPLPSDPSLWATTSPLGLPGQRCQAGGGETEDLVSGTSQVGAVGVVCGLLI